MKTFITFLSILFTVNIAAQGKYKITEYYYVGFPERKTDNVYRTGFILKNSKNEDVNVGEWKYYYESTRLWKKGNYKNGYLDGIWKEYFDEDGKLKSVGSYENGYMVGIWKEYYALDGEILKSEIDYGYNQDYIYITEYHPSGKIKSISKSEDGENVGLWQEFEYYGGKIKFDKDYDLHTGYKFLSGKDEKGNDIKRDYSLAKKLLLRSANRGNAQAMFNLGIMYHQGLGVEKSEEYALKWYKKSGANGNYNGYYNAAALILEGENLIIDQMNSLGNTKEDDIKYNGLKEKRNELLRNALIYLNKANKLNPDDVYVKTTIDNINNVLGL